MSSHGTCCTRALWRHDIQGTVTASVGMWGFAVSRPFGFLAAIFAGLSVGAGAFGAHLLKGIISADMLVVFETAVRYQMYHALALLTLSGMLKHIPERDLRTVCWCFVAGIVLFSGSLYVVALTSTRWVGAITPLGGTAFLAGWIMLAWKLWQKIE